MRNAVHSISLDNHPIVVLTVIAVANYSLITYHFYLKSAPHIILSRNVEKYCLPLRFTTFTL
jgi:hypothetical protein